MTPVKILDCTLRDGGYVNNFAFGKRGAKEIVTQLVASGVECVEIGFLRDRRQGAETTIFTSFKAIDELLGTARAHAKFFVMVKYGAFSVNNIPLKESTYLHGIRVTFKKNEINQALEYIKKIQDKGYIVSANPTGIHQYTEEELLELVAKVNEYHPEIFAMVDTLGLLKPNALLKIFHSIDDALDRDIALGFHSHNNLQLSLPNALVLLGVNAKRELIIDSSVRGMGRGAGNLCTELIVSYMNDSLGRQYNLIPVLKIIDEHINKIYALHRWGYSVPYCLSALSRCHPNYASFLVDKATVSVESISEILSLIPEEKKTDYDEALIQDIYLRYQENDVDDSEVCGKLRSEIAQHKVLLIASGKNMVLYRDTVISYIREQKPYVISLNFRPRGIGVDKVFISNVRRYGEMEDKEGIIVTSNIKTEGTDTVNYGSYLNNSEMPDNCALMMIKLLIALGVKDVICAGMDGFTGEKEAYIDVSMGNYARSEGCDNRNEVMREMLHEFAKRINIHFLTPSSYE